MISKNLFLMLIAGYFTLQGGFLILCGAFQADRSSYLRKSYNAQDVVTGLIYVGIAALMVML